MHGSFAEELCFAGSALILSVVCGAIARYARQPMVLGAMMGGLLMSISFGWTNIMHEIHAGHSPKWLSSTAEFAAMLLLFDAGLESNLDTIKADAKTGLKVAMAGVVCPLLGGLLYTRLWIDAPWPVALFQGGVFAATSVGITAAVLAELGVLRTAYARIIISAAVIDDVLGLVVLAICQAINTPEGADLVLISRKIVVAAIFVFAVPVVSHHFAGRIITKLHSLNPQAQGAIILGWMMLYGSAASYAGLAPIVGAYFAGVALDEAYFTNGGEKQHTVEHFIKSLVLALSPIFFIYAMCVVDPRIFLSVDVLANGLVFTGIAMVGKLACGLFAKPGERLLVGIGMSPRGEVGIIFTTIGLSQKILTPELFGASMIMVILTTVLTPPLLNNRVHKIKYAAVQQTA